MGRTRLKIAYIWYLVFFLAISCDADDANDTNEINIWPMPVSVSFGSGNLHLSNNFELVTRGSMFADGSGILKEAFFRTIDVVRSSHVVELDTSKIKPSLVLKGIHVVISSPSDEVRDVCLELSTRITALNKSHISSAQKELLFSILFELNFFSTPILTSNVTFVLSVAIWH